MKVPCIRLYRVGALNTGSLFVLTLDQLVIVQGGCDYLCKRACMRYVNGHTHADWIDCSTNSAQNLHSLPIHESFLP